MSDSRSLDALPLPPAAARVLRLLGCTTPRSVTRLSRRELLALPGMGSRRLTHLVKALEQLGLAPAIEPDDPASLADADPIWRRADAGRPDLDAPTSLLRLGLPIDVVRTLWDQGIATLADLLRVSPTQLHAPAAPARGLGAGRIRLLESCLARYGLQLQEDPPGRLVLWGLREPGEVELSLAPEDPAENLCACLRQDAVRRLLRAGIRTVREVRSMDVDALRRIHGISPALALLIHRRVREATRDGADPEPAPVAARLSGRSTG